MQEYLENIVSLINDNYLLQAFTSASMRNCKGYGISQPVQRDKDGRPETLPMIKIGDEFEYCGPEDTENLRWYHKNNGTSSSIAPKTGYGRSNGFTKDTVQMSIIVFGLSQNLNKTGLGLRDMFSSNLLQRLTKAQRNSMGIVSATIQGAGSDMNMLNVFKRELPSAEYNLNEGHIYFEFRYTIEAVLKAQQCVSC